MLEKSLLSGEYRSRRAFRRRLRAAVAVLAVLVAVCTGYALILPAVTMEKTCDIPQHTHGEGCYETRTTTVLTCQPHVHSAGCYHDGALTCGQADFYVHSHGESCYGVDGALLCPLPEVCTHTHGESCYETRTHTHGPECYTRERGELICQLEGSPGHSHDNSCTGTFRELVCGLEESETHTHTDDCYETREKTCPLEESSGHTHTDECYLWTETLTCQTPETEQVLTCEKPQIILHTHDASCYHGGKLTCGKTEVLAHVHGEGCFGQREERVLICTQQEHTHGDGCTVDTPSLMAGANLLTLEEGTGETQPETTMPLTFTPTSAKLYYKTEETDWTEVKKTDKLPGNASFRLNVGFQVKSEDLKKAGYQMEYSPLPTWFRDVQESGHILDSNNKEVGTMQVENGKVILTFDENWSGLTEETLKGSFNVNAQADLTKLSGGDSGDITVGNTNIKVTFDDDLIAKYGQVTFNKTMGTLEENVVGTDGKAYDYITYTLTVTAGPDGCPDVKVTDSFTEGNQYIAEYILPENSGAAVENKTMTWTVGDMVANETKTLTYKVRLDPTYLGIQPKKDALTNVASLSSNGHERAEDSATFTPKGTATMSKIAGTYTPDRDASGNAIPGGTIEYTVWVHANEDNNYTLENVHIWDALDGSIESAYKTDDKILPYLSYVEDSFRYYEGGSFKQNGSSGLTEAQTSETPQFATNGKSFKFNVGNLAPNEGRVLIYTVKVDAQAFTATNVNFDIENRAYIISDPARADDGGGKLEAYWTRTNINAKTWARKLLGDKTTEEKTVTMDPAPSEGENSFTVPAGSYQYRVVVNEDGDWDVSSTILKDQLDSQYMAYVGYLRVDAYSIQPSTVGYTNTEDVAAADKLAEMTPTATKWVDIDGKTDFNITPKDIDLTGQYAYLLTYYAKPTGYNYSTVNANNQFSLSGTIGVGDRNYTLPEVQVNVSASLEGNRHFGVTKKFWYYDAEAEVESQSNGTLYWLIKMDGTIQQGTMLLDAISVSNHTIGKVERAFVSGSEPEVSAGGDLMAFDDYTAKITDEGLEITLNQEVTLEEGKSLYFVVSTYPTTVPTHNAESVLYGNTLKTRDPGEDAQWQTVSSDQTYLVGGGNIYKSVARVFQVTSVDTEAKTITTEELGGDATTKLQPDILAQKGTGIYVAWTVTINEASTLEGRYRVVETLPEGMEMAYVQFYSFGQAYRTKPSFVKQSLDGYTETVVTFQKQYDANPITAYYYTKGQEVVWDVDGLVAKPDQPFYGRLVMLVVCKVTDSRLFLSGKEQSYVNRATIQDTQGNPLGTGSAEVKMKTSSMGKSSTYGSTSTAPGQYPFEIRLNPLGVDLLPGESTITLIDEMCDKLTLDPGSVKVVNTNTNAEVTYTLALVGSAMYLGVPDDQPLTITYTATVNAAPGEAVDLTNKAHWQGYDPTEDSTVTVPDFSYSVDAQVEASTNPTLTISKVDQYSATTKLPGATFTLTEMALVNGTFAEKADGLALTGTSDENGQIVFGGGEIKLSFNVLYRLKETKAPDGYVLDETPQDFLFARKEKQGEENTEVYPPVVTAAQNSGATILYATPHYTHTAQNHKGEVVVEKLFQNADGTPVDKIDGTYTFGLYRLEDGTEALVQKATIQWASGTATPKDGKAHFTNVELGKTYKVYELDDSGNPMTTAGTANGLPFIVTYEANSVTLSAQTPQATVKVTNRANYPELPNTGGGGTWLFTLSGGLALLAALQLLYRKRYDLRA